MATEAKPKRSSWQTFVNVATVVGFVSAVIGIALAAPVGQCLATGRYCEFAVKGPDITDEVNVNLLAASEFLKRQNQPSTLEIEPKKFLFGGDRVFVYAHLEQGKRTLVDLLDVGRVESTSIQRIAQENVYVVAYEKARPNDVKEVRLKFFDVAKGLQHSTISLYCENDRDAFTSPWFEVSNERFDRSRMEFSFDFDSNCTKLTQTVGDEIDIGDLDYAKTRIRVTFDQGLVVDNVTADRGVRDTMEKEKRWEAERKNIDQCVDALARRAKTERDKQPGWLGKCTEVTINDNPYASNRIHGRLVYYTAAYWSEDYPRFATDSTFFNCDGAPSFGHEIFDDANSMVFMCASVTRGEVKPGWIGLKSQVVRVSIYRGPAQVGSFTVACDCRGLSLRNFRSGETPRALTFEIGADNDSIRVNGTPHSIGKLPSGHTEGEPYHFGRFAIHLTDGGLLSSFDRAAAT